MAEPFTFDFGYDDIDDDHVERLPGTGEESDRVVAIASEAELLVARPHSIEEMVGRGVVSFVFQFASGDNVDKRCCCNILLHSL